MSNRLKRFKNWLLKPKWMEYSVPICAQALLGLIFLAFAMPSGSGICFFLAVFGMMPFTTMGKSNSIVWVKPNVQSNVCEM